MKITSAVSVLAGLAGLILSSNALGCGDYHIFSLTRLARRAMSTDPDVSTAAIAQLRAAGPAGLNALFELYEPQISAAHARAVTPVASPPDEEWPRIKAALEAVAQQRDCEASKLFWYTDLDQAKAAAKAAGKPILSLRLLGKLNEEYSCANSRFFRTTLYANSQVSAYLRDHFILHWKSVRPIPRITIDFGDGRKIERTITGNSVHYVLDSDGSIIDALPGLYGAKAFLSGLKEAEVLAQTVANANLPQRANALQQYHRAHQVTTQTALWQDLALIEKPIVSLASVTGGESRRTNSASAPNAREAARVAFSKSAIEMPMLRPNRATPQPGTERIQNNLSDELWGKIAALHTEDAALDQSSKALIRAKSANAPKAGALATGKRQIEDPLLRSIRNLERSISEDTVRNEYLLHSKIHQWLADNPAPDLDQFNSRVYAELFLTPDSDPWLGLAPADVYSALDNDGLIVSQAR